MGKIVPLVGEAKLREHIFGDPLVAPTPDQTHSYIFPGDELFLYHKVPLPGAVASEGATQMSDIKLISATVSIIAKKPQVFSEEFGPEFQSTRTFALDSFTVSFNNGNAPVIPWNGGVDGYAPNLTVNQDQQWKLPPGDLRRLIKFFTKHINLDPTWYYYFYYPILFRWEYWFAKLNANNDFYDSGLPNNGLNEFWFRYHSVPTWLIFSRLELNMLVKGNSRTVRSELSLSSIYADSINTYSSNPDWINKSIKTVDVGSGNTPSNSPAFIYGNRDTAVFAYFEKNTAFGGSEQGGMHCFMWVEPFEGGGIGVRTRASSKYLITPESVFKGLSTAVTDTSGTKITTSSGDFVTADPTGVGVVRSFSVATPKKIFFVGIIDHNKLAVAYPGVTKFTVYARLYNGSVITGGTLAENPIGQMKKGEELKQDLTLVAPLDTDSLCDLRAPQCPYNFEVFADAADNDPVKNDKSDFFGEKYCGDALITNIQLTLQRADYNCGEEWVDKVTFSSSAYGPFFAFGKANDFSGANYLDEYGKKYTGLFLDWQTVLKAWGAGRYRMKITKTDAFTNTSVDYDLRIFCLKAYHCNLADGTVRIEIVTNGVRGTITNNQLLVDYQTAWKSEIRLPGLIKYKGSSYDQEFNEYDDGSFNSLKPISSRQRPKFVLSLRPIPGWMDFIVSTNILQGDEIYITDYNAVNRHKFKKLPVINDGDMTPVDNNLANPLTNVDITLSYGQNSLRKRNP